MNKLLQGLVVATGIFLASQAVLAEGDAEAGKAKSAVCMACHGADGNSLVPSFPKLAGLGENYLLKQMKDIQSGDRATPEMTGMLGASSEQDLADMAAFFNSNTIKVADASGPDLDIGEILYRVGNAETGVPACTGCHSPTGSGNAPAGYPALGGQHAAYLVKQLQAFRTGADDQDNPAARNNDGETRAMRGVAAHLSDREIRAVSNYISSLH